MDGATSLSRPLAAPAFRLPARPLAALFLLVILGINGPIFLRMGLDSDVCMYDLCARGIEHGQVHYRDQLETNFPGVVWIHVAVRTIAGWSAESLRAFDLFVVGIAAVFIAQWTPPQAGRGSRLFVVSMLMAFYFSTSEWCHCQRDFWMLAPSLWALRLRERRIEQGMQGPDQLSSAFLEGALWAAACWIKPYVAIPAAMCWLFAVAQLRRTGVSFRRIALDGSAFFSGGLAVGIAGAYWLMQTGAWTSFVEVMFDWNRDYIAHDSTLGRRWDFLFGFILRFTPWIVAVAFAFFAAASTLANRQPTRLLLPSVFVLGWLAQAFLLQHPFDYVRAPVLFLAMGLAFAWAFASPSATVGRWTVALSLAAVVSSQAGVWKRRVDLVGDCIRGPASPELRDELTGLWRVDWTDLDATIAFLRRQTPLDREVTCYSLPVVPIYNELGLAPSTRYLFLHDHLNIFLRHRGEIKQAIAASPQRWLVCDLKRFGASKLVAVLDGEAANPWKSRVVFRSGQYVVFEMNGEETTRWIEEFYGL